MYLNLTITETLTENGTKLSQPTNSVCSQNKSLMRHLQACILRPFNQDNTTSSKEHWAMSICLCPWGLYQMCTMDVM